MKKRHVFLIIIILYLIVAAAYFSGRALLSDRGLEYRLWAEVSARAVLWCVPLALFGILLWNIRCRLAAGGKRGLGSVFLGIFILFIIGGTLASAREACLFALQMESESRMPDGNLLVTKTTGYDYNYYYAEPVWGVARRRFVWDREHYASSLSRIYDAEFTAVEDEALGTVYRSDAYPGIDVQVWGAGRGKSDYLDENLRYLAAGAELKRKGEAFFGDAAHLTEYTVDKGGA